MGEEEKPVISAMPEQVDEALPKPRPSLPAFLRVQKSVTVADEIADEIRRRAKRRGW